MVKYGGILLRSDYGIFTAALPAGYHSIKYTSYIIKYKHSPPPPAFILLISRHLPKSLLPATTRKA